MDRDELLSNYVDAFKRKRQEIAKAIDASFISGKLHKIRTFPDDELDILADLIPPEQNVNCVQLLRDAKDLDRFSKFSAALSPDKREKLFPFVRDAPPALHPSYRTWELRIMRHRAEKPTHLLVLTTNRREFEFAVKWSSVYPPVNAKETEELWGEVKIFHLPLQDAGEKRVVIILVWERRFLPFVLDAFAPQIAILSVCLHTSHLPRVEAHERVWKEGDAILVESVQGEGGGSKAHQRIHELKLWNLLKWEGEEVEGLCRSAKQVHHVKPHPLYPLPHPHPTPLRLNFAPYEKIEALECREGTKEWLGSFYHAADQRRPEEKRGKVGDMPVFFCLATLRKGGLREGTDLSIPFVFQLLPKVVRYFYIDAKQPPPS